MKVLAVDQRYELRVLQIVFPGETYELLEGSLGFKVIEVELLFRGPYPVIGVFENGLEEVVLAVEVVVNHPLVGVRLLGDHVHPGAPQSVFCEFFLRGLEDARLGCFGIA